MRASRTGVPRRGSAALRGTGGTIRALKKALLILGALVVLCGGMSIAVFLLGKLQESQAQQKAAVEGVIWGSEVTGICPATNLPEKLGVLPAQAKIAFHGRSPGGQVEVWTGAIPLKIRASGKNDITHVGCVEHSIKALQACSYTTGHIVQPQQHVAVVRLVDRKARTVVARWVAVGPEPVCPQTIQRRRGDAQTETVTGDYPDLAEGLRRLTSATPPKGDFITAARRPASPTSSMPPR